MSGTVKFESVQYLIRMQYTRQNKTHLHIVKDNVKIISTCFMRWNVHILTYDWLSCLPPEIGVLCDEY